MNAYCLTDVGRRRSSNQDYAYVSEEPVGNLPNLFVVADGMGGHAAGDLASRYAVEALTKSIRKEKREKNPIRILTKGIEKANVEVLAKAGTDPALRGMGTTLVAATVSEGCLYVANVGDSRLYLIREHIRQVTKDHSLVEEMVRLGELTEEQARNHPDKNIITRALGAERTVDVDFFDLKLEPESVILMCSDGLSNMVEDSRIKEILSRRDEALDERGRTLIGEANRNGGKDNIAIVLIEPFANEVEEC